MIEKFKALEPKQRILVVMGAICLLSIILMLLFPGSDDGEQSTLDAFETPENRDEIEDYNSKLEAYGDDMDEGGNVSLEFNLDAYSDEEMDEDEQLEKEVDSMLNANKMSYSDKPRSSGRSRGSTNATTSSSSRRTKKAAPASNTNENINEEFNSFFNSAPESSSGSFDSSAKTDPFIYAVIHGDHTIKQGERVKLRLTRKATIADMEFTQNSYIYAFPTFQENRVLLTISSINHVPVSIDAYDTEDSAIGLYVKGAKMVGQITDESTKDAVDDVDVGGVPVGTTIKKVFQKKQQIPTVTLLNNTKLILKPNKR